MREGVGHDLADLGTVEHHIDGARLLAGEDEKVRLHLRTAREAVLGRKGGRRDDGKFEIGVFEIHLRRRGRGRKVFGHHLPAQHGHLHVLLLGKFDGDRKAVREDVDIDIGQLLGKIERRRAAVHEDGAVFFDEARRFLRDGDLLIRLRSDLARVALARDFLYFFDGHGAPADADDPAFLFEL